MSVSVKCLIVLSDLIYISSVIKDVKHHFMYFLAIDTYLEKCLQKFLLIFKNSFI